MDHFVLQRISTLKLVESITLKRVIHIKTLEWNPDIILEWIPTPRRDSKKSEDHSFTLRE